MHYLYAVTGTPSDPPKTLRGVDRAPIRYRRSGRLWAVHSPVALAPEPTPLRLWQHTNVVETAMLAGPVVPSSFATLAADEAALDALIEAHAGVLTAALDRLDGCVEVSLRVVRVMATPVLAPGGDGSGGVPVDRLDPAVVVAQRAARAQTEAEARRDALLYDVIRGAIEGSCEDLQVHPSPGPNVVLHAACLVERALLDVLRRQVRELAGRYRELHFVCTGPWPPYHFAPPLHLPRR